MLFQACYSLEHGAKKYKIQVICRLRRLKHFFACRKHVQIGILFKSIHYINEAIESKKSLFPPF